MFIGFGSGTKTNIMPAPVMKAENTQGIYSLYIAHALVCISQFFPNAFLIYSNYQPLMITGGFIFKNG